MAYCSKCGRELGSRELYCPDCGTPVDLENTQEENVVADGINRALRAMENTEDLTAEFDPEDVERNKGLTVLSYFGLLFLIPLLVRPRSRYTRFHVNQGLVLFVVGIVYNVGTAMLKAAVKMLMTPGAIFGLVEGVLTILSVMFPVLMILGIVNAVNGRAKRLPFLGKITFVRYDEI